MITVFTERCILLLGIATVSTVADFAEKPIIKNDKIRIGFILFYN
jgi:hypothetical protein